MIDRLTPQERIVAWRLQTGRCVPDAELIVALYGNDPNGGPLDATGVVDQVVHRLRRKTAAHGVVIERLTKGKDTSPLGWLVPAACLARFRDLLADEIDRNVVCGSGSCRRHVSDTTASPKPSPAAASEAQEAAHG